MTNPISPVINRLSFSDFQSFVEQIVADLKRPRAERTWVVYTRLKRVVQNIPSSTLEFQPERAKQNARRPRQLYHGFADGRMPPRYCNGIGNLAGHFPSETGHFLKLSRILSWIILARNSKIAFKRVVHHAQIGETRG